MLYRMYYSFALLCLCLLHLPMGAAAQELPIRNFNAVDSILYRSAQLKAREFKALEQEGFTTVINLRRYWKDNRKVSKSNIQPIHVPVKTTRMSESDLVQIFKVIATARAKGKVLIHCWHGSDRTGTVIALYRIIYHGWSKEDALNEMINGGYGYHSYFDNLPQLIRSLDIEQFKRRVFDEK